MNHGHFDERSWERYYFGQLTQKEVEDLFENESCGTFLLRASSTIPDTLVICVKENNEVAKYQIKTSEEDGKTCYKIRDDWSFNDIPSLLSFYKRNLFKFTSLVKPLIVDVTKRHHSNSSDTILQRYSEIFSNSSSSSSKSRNIRQSAPPSCSMRLSRHSRDEGLPLYVKVIKARVPSPYQKDQLSLSIGDEIKVLRRGGDQWEGELKGNRGFFPFTHVKLPEETPP